MSKICMGFGIEISLQHNSHVVCWGQVEQYIETISNMLSHSLYHHLTCLSYNTSLHKTDLT